MPVHLVDLMTKEQIVSVIVKSKCKMLVGLPLKAMTKEDIVRHLKRSCCPELKKLW